MRTAEISECSQLCDFLPPSLPHAHIALQRSPASPQQQPPCEDSAVAPLRQLPACLPSRPHAALREEATNPALKDDSRGTTRAHGMKMREPTMKMMRELCKTTTPRRRKRQNKVTSRADEANNCESIEDRKESRETRRKRT